MRQRFLRRAVLAGLVVTLAGGAIVAVPTTAAADDPAKTAPTAGSEFEAFAMDVMTQDGTISGVGIDENGRVVISAQMADLSKAMKAELTGYANVILEDRETPKPKTLTDVVGADGYSSDGLCSFGFSAWSPTDKPAVVTTGHCVEEGDQVTRTAPSKDDASFYPARSPLGPTGLDGAILGTTTFSRDDLGVGVDFAAIDVTDPALTPKPFVTDWSSSFTEDLSLVGTPVTDVGSAEAGDAITFAGRTSGQHTGTILGAGIFRIAGTIFKSFDAQVIALRGDRSAAPRGSKRTDGHRQLRRGLGDRAVGQRRLLDYAGGTDGVVTCTGNRCRPGSRSAVRRPQEPSSSSRSTGVLPRR